MRERRGETICPASIDSLVAIWTSLHREADFRAEPAEGRYIQEVVLGMDDELIARLLGAKADLASGAGAEPAQDVVRLGSQVVFEVEGRVHRARLVHGTAEGGGKLGVGTRFGAALLGLRRGAAILWPGEDGPLVEVRVVDVMAWSACSDDASRLATSDGPVRSCATNSGSGALPAGEPDPEDGASAANDNLPRSTLAAKEKLDDDPTPPA